MPAYGITEVGHYLQIPPSTLRSWVKGRFYPTEAGHQFFEPLIALPEVIESGPILLSFINVVEVHVLDALRQASIDIQIHDDHFSQNATDEYWLREV